MDLVFLVFITFNVILEYKFASSNYLASEANLLKVLSSYIDEREVYLKKMTRYLDAIERSYNATKNVVCAEYSNDYLKNAWNEYKILKRLTVDWKIFLNALNNDTYITHKIKKSVIAKNRGIYADWTMEKNDYKLIHIVRSLKVQKLSIKRQHKETVGTQLKEKILLKMRKLKESLKKFANVARYQSERPTSYWNDYRRLCRGEVLLNEENNNLKCRYVHNDKPYLRIGPFKQEELYSDPQILMFHDVLFDGEIQKIQKLSSQQEMFISQGKETLYRVAKVTWLASGHTLKISQRVGLMTELNMTSAEYLQVAVSGLAGHYEPHYDSGLDKTDPTSTRIATILFYMNDVAKGGATVFPRLKLAVSPKKGSAIFWYNIKPDYEVDSRNIHGGCPLYSGVKWVMNWWVRRAGQEFTKPCMAEHHESFIY